MRKAQPVGSRGSLKWMQRLASAHPALLDQALRNAGALEPDAWLLWRSPTPDDERAEYRDASFLDRVGYPDAAAKLAAFWPRGGPQWDGLARDTDGRVYLIEAKAHAPELQSSCAASPQSRARIAAALDWAKQRLGVPLEADWLNGYYQYANRVTHLMYLQEELGVPATLVFLYFTGDTAMRRPAAPSEWEAALQPVYRQLGIDRAGVPKGLVNAFVDVSQLS